MSDLYTELTDNNIYIPIANALREKKILKTADGRLKLNTIKGNIPPDNPWVFSGTLRKDRKCDLWTDVYFKVYGFIPMGCMKCRKIAVTVKSVSELMLLHDIQAKIDLESKCGIDIRSHTGARYAGFWYCPWGCTLKEAQGLFWDIVRPSVVNGGLPDADIILKRGCTEMEQQTRREYGIGSKDWENLYSPQTKALEEKLNKSFIYEFSEGLECQTDEQKMLAIQKWLDYAFMTDDPTHKEFDDSGSFIKRYPPSDEYQYCLCIDDQAVSGPPDPNNLGY